MCMCAHEIHSKIDVNFCIRNWQYEAMFTVATFSEKSMVMDPSMSQNMVSMIFFTDG